METLKGENMKINKSKLVEQLNNYIKNTPKTKPIDYSTIPELEPIGNKSIDEINSLIPVLTCSDLEKVKDALEKLISP